MEVGIKLGMGGKKSREKGLGADGENPTNFLEKGRVLNF